MPTETSPRRQPDHSACPTCGPKDGKISLPPAPWHWRPVFMVEVAGQMVPYTALCDADDRILLSIPLYDRKPGDLPDTAGAHLIAAAPDLLAACKALLNVLQGFGEAPSQADTDAACRVASAAIAKAGGAA